MVGTCALAADEEHVYYAVDHSEGRWETAPVVVYRLLKENHHTYAPIGGKLDTVLATWSPADLVKYSKGSWELYPHGFTPNWLRSNLMGLAVDDRYIYTSLFLENQILVTDKNTGEQVKRIDVERPCGLAVDPDHTVLAITGRHVVELDAARGRLGTIRIGRELDAPIGLWVAEDYGNPKGVSVWDHKGQLFKEYIGPTYYGDEGGCVNPYRPQQVFGMGEDQYSVEAAIPLQSLGLTLDSEQTLQGDVGVIFSDRAGTKNVLRVYWSKKATGLVSDLYSESRVQPAMWGRIEVRKGS